MYRLSTTVYQNHSPNHSSEMEVAHARNVHAGYERQDIQCSGQCAFLNRQSLDRTSGKCPDRPSQLWASREYHLSKDWVEFYLLKRPGLLNK